MAATSREYLQVDARTIRFEDTISHQMRRVTMNDSVEARGHRRGSWRRNQMSRSPICRRLIRIDGEPKLEFKMDEISEALGRPMTAHIFEISTSTSLWAHG